MKKRFFGGVHPVYRKELAGHNEAIVAPVPSVVTIPLRQHIGAICSPLVKVGDKVKMGQKIGDGHGLCVPVHSSVSGTVIKIGPCSHISGNDIESVVIENDYLDTPDMSMTAHADISSLDREELLAIIREAGIVGMGGATFPTDIKANVPVGEIDTVIVNACECEPYITADDSLICSNALDVLKGLDVMIKITQPKHVFFAIEDNKKDAAEEIKKHLPEFPEVTLEILPTLYPQGSEKQLIVALTGREVPSGKLPKDVGCVVFNAATYASIYRAVYLGLPLTRRIVTFSGEGMKEPKNMVVRIGTPISFAIENAGGITDDTLKVVAGGPMMGTALKSLDVPTVKGTNAILALEENVEPKHLQCIRCGKCADHCPMRLQPLFMYRYEKAKDFKELERLHIQDCMECGCCAYICPAKLPLVEVFRRGKKELKEWKTNATEL